MFIKCQRFWHWGSFSRSIIKKWKLKPQLLQALVNATWRGVDLWCGETNWIAYQKPHNLISVVIFWFWLHHHILHSVTSVLSDHRSLIMTASPKCSENVKKKMSISKMVWNVHFNSTSLIMWFSMTAYQLNTSNRNAPPSSLPFCSVEKKLCFASPPNYISVCRLLVSSFSLAT